jgi:membrane protein DedA with SNARE-associated domain
MLPVVGQLVQQLNAFSGLLWATTVAVAGYLLGKVLELVFGDLARVANPLLIRTVVLTAAWMVDSHVSGHRRGSPLPSSNAAP